MGTCNGAYATADEYSQQWFYSFGDEDKVEITPLLVKSAGRIHAVLASQGMCDCALAEWTTDYLKELNMVAAVVMFNIACVRLSDEQRLLFSEYLNGQLELIRNGDLELCAGETGKNFPAFGIAQYSITDRNAAEIVVNRLKREGD